MYFQQNKEKQRGGGMKGRSAFFATFPAMMVALIACAPAVQTQPVDPTTAQITILQKQLLELQNLQNENRRRVAEQTAITDTLSLKVKALEERQSMSPASSQITPMTSATQKIASEKEKKAKVKKKKKKKKTVRRQEQ